MTFVYQQTTRLYPHGYFNSLVVQAIGTTQLLGTLSHFIWHGLASSEQLKRVCENQFGTLPIKFGVYGIDVEEYRHPLHWAGSLQDALVVAEIVSDFYQVEFFIQ